MLNTYGLKMKGIKAAAGDTKYIDSAAGRYVQISYNEETGDIYSDYQISCNSWNEYHDRSIFTAIRATCPMTMQEIADGIKTALDDRKAWTEC